MVDFRSVKSPSRLFLWSLLAGCGRAPEVEETSPPEPGEELYFPPDSGEWEGIDPASGMDVNAYTSQWLTSRVGMQDSGWWTRPGKVMVPWANVIGFVTTARDLARFGLLMQARGNWDGEDLLQNPDYFERMLSPSTVANPSYGFLWWLNGGDRWIMGRENTEAREGSLVPPAPDDLFAGRGALGRKVYVVPSLGLVFTRLGDQPPEGEFSNEIWKRLMKAAPGS